MKTRRLFAFAVAVAGAVSLHVAVNAQQGVGQNLNIVTGSADQYVGDMFRQRQNESVLGISSVNPSHMMAAYNDYRTVDFVDANDSVPPSPIGVFAKLFDWLRSPWSGGREREKEGEAESDSAQAWIGLSFTDNGKDWYTGLHPGFRLLANPTPPGAEGWDQSGALTAYDAASDPVMALTPNRFFVAGIAFTPGGNSAGFVSRFTDRNDTETGRNIHFDGTRVLTTQPSGFFVDKPNIVAGPNGHVYVSFVLFDQQDPQNLSSKIVFYRSADYGVSWQGPTTVSDPLTRNQSPWMLVDPNNENTVYLGWRVFASKTGGIANAIVGRKSTDGGASFFPSTPYTVASKLKAFDQPQGTLPQSLPIPRSNAYPTAAIDGNGAIHVAIQEYVSTKDGTPLGSGKASSSGVPRITVTSSYDGGVNWTARAAVDYGPGSGTQFMPVLTAVGEPGPSCQGSSGPRSRVMLMYYDARSGNVGTQTGTDGYVAGGDKQFDVRIAQAPSCPRDSSNRVVFGSSVQMSRYPLTAAEPHTILTTGQPAPYNIPAVNRAFSAFCGGNCAFTGDYIHLIPRIPYVQTATGWKATTAAGVDKTKLPAPVVQGVWADTRDVLLPVSGTRSVPPGASGIDALAWDQYSPPGTGSPSCVNPGSRDQNVYTAEFAPGELFASAPETFRTANIPRAYPIYVENRAGQQRLFRLTIDANANAAFNYKAFTSPPQETAVKIADVAIAAYSSVTGSVVVAPLNSAPILVTIEQVNGNGVPVSPSLKTTVTLHTAGSSAPTTVETHAPSVTPTPVVTKPFKDRTPFTATTPFTQTPFTQTPFTQTPFTQTPFTQNPFSQTPFTQTTTVFDVSDISFLVTNGGDSTAAYSALLSVANAQQIEESKSYLFQVIINRLSPVPLLKNCQSGDGVQNIQISNILAPFTQTPFTQTPFTQTPFTQTPFTQTPFTQTPFTQTSDPRDPVVTNSTFYVAPPTAPDPSARATPRQPEGRLVNARLLRRDGSGRMRVVEVQSGSDDYRAERPGDVVMYTLRAYQIKDSKDSTFVTLFPNGQPQVGISVKSDTPDVILVNGAPAFDPNGPTTSNGGAAVPVALAFVTQPSAADAGAAITPSVQVAVRDGFGNPVTGATTPITLAIGTNGGPGGVLSGTLTRSAVGGVATFPGLSIDKPGDYTLVATAASLAAATSAPFTVRNPTFVVVNTNDDGPGSLRQAMTAANALQSGVGQITFNVQSDGTPVIQPLSALPAITRPMVIDGTTQPGASGRPGVVLNGALAGASSGLVITGANSTIRGLVINSFSEEGILIGGEAATGNLITGNYIGTDASGFEYQGNANSGVYIRRAPANSLVGNVISGNYGFAGVAVCGNLSFCGGPNDQVATQQAAGNIIRGNFIGTGADGSSWLGNRGRGVSIDSAPNTIVGGTAEGAGNVIANNGYSEAGSQPGVVIFGPDSSGNQIRRNSIHDNAGLGIDLGANGVTLNDLANGDNILLHDQDSGPNGLQNFPVLTSAAIDNGATTVQGSLSTTPNTNVTIDFYGSVSCDASGYGEGQTWLGSTALTADGAGNLTFSAQVGLLASGTFVTATATAPNGTSEFSGCQMALPPQYAYWPASQGGNGHVYEYVKDGGLQWDAAATAAGNRSVAGMAGHLVSITSDEENTFANALRQGGLMRAWIGLYDPDGTSTATWTWSTGETATYFKWSSGEPNNPTTEFWVEMFTDGTWNNNQILDPTPAFRTDGYIVEYEPSYNY